MTHASSSFLVAVILLSSVLLPIGAANAVTTVRVSVDSSGTEGDGESRSISHTALSSGGRYVAFTSFATNLVTGDTNGVADIFVHDGLSGTTTRVSVSSAGAQADGDSGRPSISSNGRYVAFDSAATNLVTGDASAIRDIFVHDRQRSPLRLQ